MRRLERVERRPGQDAYLHPAGTRVPRQQELSAGPILELTPPGGDAWIAVVDVSGERRTGGRAGPILIGLPDRRSLCVLFGGRGVLLTADDPEAAGEVPASPVTGHLTIADRELVLFSSFTAVAAYGPSGLAWHAQRLALDDVQLHRVSGATLHLSGFFGDPAHVQEPFTLDLTTGEVEGRPFEPPA